MIIPRRDLETHLCNFASTLNSVRALLRAFDSVSFDSNAGSKRGGSELTFKFLRDSNEDQRNHDKWRDSEYQQMLSFLRRVFQDTKKLHVVTYVCFVCPR